MSARPYQLYLIATDGRKIPLFEGCRNQSDLAVKYEVHRERLARAKDHHFKLTKGEQQ